MYGFGDWDALPPLARINHNLLEPPHAEASEGVLLLLPRLLLLLLLLLLQLLLLLLPRLLERAIVL